jgi:hypothetical protein
MEGGFSGTQDGMTVSQLVAIDSLIPVLSHAPYKITTWHIGDCVGADAEFHEIVTGHGCYTVGHPPIKRDKRAFLKYDELWPEYEYLVRNQHIVDCASRMVFGPGQMREQRRSGTWSTKRKAERKGIPFEIVLPDGTISTYATTAL